MMKLQALRRSLILVSALSAATPVLAQQLMHPDGPRLHVVGNHLENRQGKKVRLQGVNIPGLEWSATGDHTLQSVEAAIKGWNAKLIRVPLCQDLWFGHPENPAKAPAADGGAAYRRLVDQVVAKIASHNCYALLDLHWSDGDKWSQNVAQHCMPDNNSLQFWHSFARRYANNAMVLFDLYNEPHDVSWDVWQHGGEVEEHNADPSRGLSLHYHTPGMQALLDTVRATGAKNVVVAGGLDWAYDLGGLLEGHALRDEKSQGIMYATHIYPWKKDWDQHITPASAKYAVLVGEVGCNPWKPGDPDYQKVDCATWAPEVLAYINRHQFNWTAWSFHPGASPCVITGWTYQPTPYWGKYVKAALAGPTGLKKEAKR